MHIITKLNHSPSDRNSHTQMELIAKQFLVNNRFLSYNEFILPKPTPLKTISSAQICRQFKRI